MWGYRSNRRQIRDIGKLFKSIEIIHPGEVKNRTTETPAVTQSKKNTNCQ